ncbi:hypothetical protein DFH29DRAFT_1008162 [Suillus ampliporus]|nr:hypothetical protein DFH29DRAFT_1008162 [Suillus ampliporus]
MSDEHYQPQAQDFRRMNQLYENNHQLPGHANAQFPFLVPSQGQLNQGWNGPSHHGGSFPNNTEDYPLVNFWTHEDFTKWDSAADAQGDQRGSSPFLEHTNGDPVTASEQRTIMKTFRAVWFGLQQHGIAPISWGRAIPDARNALYKEVSRIHPELALCDRYWKIEHVARDRYPSWASTHLKEGYSSSTDPEEMKPRIKPQKRKARMVESSDTCSKHDSKRAKTSDMDLEAHDSEPPEISSSNIESPNPPSSSRATLLLPLSPSPKPQTNNPPKTLFAPIRNPLKDAIIRLKEKKNNEPRDALPTPPIALADTAMTPTAAPADTNSAISSADAPATPTASDPTTSLTLPTPSADDTNAPHADTVDLPSVSAATPIEARGTSTPSESVTLQVVNADSQGKPGPTSKNFRPATTKNGRTLCAHRWLKQVAPNGYSRDFKLYWDSLDKDRQEKYETDAKKLISDGIWTGSTVEVIGLLRIFAASIETLPRMPPSDSSEGDEDLPLVQEHRDLPFYEETNGYCYMGGVRGGLGLDNGHHQLLDSLTQEDEPTEADCLIWCVGRSMHERS